MVRTTGRLKCRFQCVEDREDVRANEADGNDDHDGDQPCDKSIFNRGGATVIAKTFEKTRHLDPFLSIPELSGANQCRMRWDVIARVLRARFRLTEFF